MAPLSTLWILLMSQALSASKLNGVSGQERAANGNIKTENICTLEMTCGGESGTNIPLQLVRGRDGRDGRDGMPGPMGRTGPQGKPGTPGSPNKEPSAFMVKLDKHRHAADFKSAAKILTFDSVVTNVGGDYDLRKGIYTAPRSGSYFFSITVAAHKSGDAAVEFHVGSVGSIGRVWAVSRPEWVSASGSFTLHLSEGKTVWIKPIKGALEYYGNAYTTFSGHMLFYD